MERHSIKRGQQYSQRARIRINQVTKRASCESCGAHGNVHYRKAMDVDLCNGCFDSLMDAGGKKN